MNWDKLGTTKIFVNDKSFSDMEKNDVYQMLDEEYKTMLDAFIFSKHNILTSKDNMKTLFQARPLQYRKVRGVEFYINTTANKRKVGDKQETGNFNVEFKLWYNYKTLTGETIPETEFDHTIICANFSELNIEIPDEEY